MEIEWKVAPYEKGDEIGIKKLQKEIYGVELEPEKESLEFWKWEFENCPDGKALINTTKVGKKITGHYAVIPIKYLLQNEEHLGGLVVDVMTDPNYRRQGMFVELGKDTMKKIKEEGYSFSTGYPYKDNVMPGHKKVGWKEIFNIDVYAFPLDPKKISIVASKNPIKRLIYKIGLYSYKTIFRYKRSKTEYSIKKIDSFPQNIDDMLNEAMQRYDFIQKRDYKLLHWRYDEPPNRKYEKYLLFDNDSIKGYIVGRDMKIFGLNTMFITDIIATHDKYYSPLIDKLYEDSKANMDIFSVAISPDEDLINIIKKKHFVNTGNRFILISYDCKNNYEKMKNCVKPFILPHDFDVI